MGDATPWWAAFCRRCSTYVALSAPHFSVSVRWTYNLIGLPLVFLGCCVPSLWVSPGDPPLFASSPDGLTKKTSATASELNASNPSKITTKVGPVGVRGRLCLARAETVEQRRLASVVQSQ